MSSGLGHKASHHRSEGEEMKKPVRITLSVVALGAALGTGAAIGSGGNQTKIVTRTVAEPAVTQTVPGPTVTVTKTKRPAPASAPAVAPSSAAPSTPTQSSASMTASQQQAVDAAQSYLSLGSGFSDEGLLQQLTSSAGSGFSKSDAEFAINYLHPDWDAQAVEAAKGYLQLGGFSHASLLQQLTSSAGSGFTEAQAEYAVNKVGL